MSNHAETFMSTLQQIEESRDPEALVALFGPDAELINLALTEPMKGQDGARKFWTNYLTAFEKIRSTFHYHFNTDKEAVMEWISEGVMAGTGQPFNYRGISVCEYEGDKVSKFRTYYDSAVFLPGGAKQKETV